MKGQYVVAGYQGNISVRFESDNNTVVYSGDKLASFGTEQEANDFASVNEEDYWRNYADDYNDDVDYFACDCCGALHSADCRCDEE